MKPLATSMDRFKGVKGNRGLSRGDVQNRFLEKLIPTRVEMKLKPYSHARRILMVQHMKGVDELEAFYKQCETAGIPFSAFFHWSLKPKKK